jgi:hypothetical protein
MALNVVLVTQRQSSKGIYLSWNAMEGVASYLVFVAQRKMSPEELEAAVLLGGTDDCTVLKLGPDATGIVDDCSPEGEPRYYGVSMNFADGAPKGARFKATADGAPPGAVSLSSKGAKKQAPSPKPAAAAPAPAAAPAAASSMAPAAPRPASIAPAAPPAARPAVAAAPAAAPSPAAAMANSSGGYRVTPPAAEAPAPAARPASVAAPAPASVMANTGGYKVPVPAEAAAPAPKPVSVAPPAPRPEPKPEVKPEVKPPPPAPKPAAAPAADLDSLSNTAFYRVAIAENPVEVVQPPREIPLEDTLEYRMKGGTQTWDGLRLYWERDFDASAYEIVIADHQLFDRELNEALAGRDDFTSCTATGPSTMCVIDNITQRDSRGWYLILARDRKGNRKVHPFQVGDSQESGKPVAVFANPNRTGELRGEVEGMLEEAREQVERWKAEGDGGAKREAKRIAADALLIYPNHPGAKALQTELA